MRPIADGIVGFNLSFNPVLSIKYVISTKKSNEKSNKYVNAMIPHIIMAMSQEMRDADEYQQIAIIIQLQVANFQLPHQKLNFPV